MIGFTRDDWRNLIERRKSIMLKLATIANGRVPAPRDPNTADVKTSRVAGSAPPPEVDLDTIGMSGPPPKERSLFAHYEWRFAAIDTAIKAAPDQAGKMRAIIRMESTCSQALRDWMIFTGTYTVPTSDTDAGNVDVLLSEYEGVDAYEAAVWLMCSAAWVKRARVANGRNGADGLSRPRSARSSRVLELAERGLSARSIASQLGVSHTTVNRVLAAA